MGSVVVVEVEVDMVGGGEVDGCWVSKGERACKSYRWMVFGF